MKHLKEDGVGTSEFAYLVYYILGNIPAPYCFFRLGHC